MKKQLKMTVLTAATALLALGTSFAAMAAVKGTWQLEDGEWYCYDRDGEAYEETFCLSNGKEFYVGEDGRMVRSAWVEHEGYWYYVNSAGEKAVNEWRYTSPAEDEDEPEQWYYLQSNGKRAEAKKLTIAGNTYYFDSEGVMLTGWIRENDETWENVDDTDLDATPVIYCDENGARVNGQWIYTYGPGVDMDEAEEEDQKWYYILSGGKPAVGKKSNINGETYFFGEDGAMLSGWVAGTGDVYEEIWNEEGDGIAHSEAAAAGKDIYFCGSADDGHAKKNKWIKEWGSENYGYEDYDVEKKWFYLQNNGKLYIPIATESNPLKAATEWTLVDVNADVQNRFDAEGTYRGEEKKINSKTYLFNQEGEMMYGFVELDGKMHYYGGADDGARKTGSFSVTDENGESTKAYFSSETNSEQGYFAGAGVNGAKSGKLYADGILVSALEDKYEMKEVDGMKFVVNKSGSIQTNKGLYKDDGDELFNSSVFTYHTDKKGVSYESIATINGNEI